MVGRVDTEGHSRIGVPRDPSGRIHLHILDGNNRKISAYSASDGTLRFLALLAAILGAEQPGLYFFEEIDNGIHPARLWHLIDLIENQDATRGLQIVATTHSPSLLSWISDESFEHVSVVYRDENADHSVIRSVAELPHARKLRKTQGLLHTLHANGWMEDVLSMV